MVASIVRKRGQPARRVGRGWAVTALVFLALVPAGAAQEAPESPTPANAVLELEFTPVARAQIAIWIERDDRLVATLRLTEAVSRRGLGNRPGASQMNSGFRWPYGRREGVLPVWAARRAEQPGARPFRRVIFQNRASEGYASRSVDDSTPDDYYCLSFTKQRSRIDALDAVTCPSVFSSDKGRFITEADVQRGYAEPYEARDHARAAHASARARLALSAAARCRAVRRTASTIPMRRCSGSTRKR